MSIDVARAREETPGCGNVLHFNNAGAGLMPTPVLEALQSHLNLEAERGGYEAHAAADSQYQSTYVSLAQLLNCDSSEIALTENATRAWDMAFYGLRLGKGDRVLTAQATYASNYLAMLQVAKQSGIVIDVVPNDRFGQVSVEELRSRVGRDVKLIALTHMPTNGGLVNPATEVGQVSRENDIPFLLDACQSAGQMPLDVNAIGCDFLSATGRKFLRGPRGTGFLYVRKSSLDRLEPPFIDLHAATWTAPDAYELQPGSKRFENWEGYVAGKIGLGVAARYAMAWGMEDIWKRVHDLGTELRNTLESIPDITVHDVGKLKGGIVTFSHDRKRSEDIKAWLATLNINVSTSSREYALIDCDSRNLPAMVRASVHYYNTEEEIGRFGFAVRSIVGA